MKNIDAVIFTYLRPEHLQAQLQSLRDQTYPIRNIIVGHLENKLTPKFDFEDVRWVTFNKDPGIKSTFITCTLVPTGCDYIFMLNDDIQPGIKYVENVMNSMTKAEGAYGAFGMQVHQKGYYNGYFPRSGKNRDIIEVSAIGQSYFFPYEYIHLFFKKQMPKPWTSSDDLWFSYMLATHNKKRLIAPHPKEYKEMWAVKKNLTNKDAAHKKLHKRNPKHKKHRRQLIKYAQKQGIWR